MRKKCGFARYLQLGFTGYLGSMGLTIFSPKVLAQSNIVPDNTLNSESSAIIPNFMGFPIELITGGANRGVNLYHSFQEFNVSTDRGAYFFSPDANIQNILARVTGNNPSEILGTLGTFGQSQPNLYLINPHGIIFGANASLDLGGSFVATTANGINLGTTGIFNASEPTKSNLLNIQPSSLFFNAVNNQAAIINQSRAISISANGSLVSGLSVAGGESLSLVGGNVILDGGAIQAPGARVELGGLAEPGIVNLTADGLVFPDNVARADVSLTNESFVFLASNQGGSINVNASNFNLLDGSYFLIGNINDQTGNITINATDKVTIQGDNSSASQIVTGTRGNGNAANIIINTGSLEMIGNADIGSFTDGKGNAANIDIRAKDQVLILGNGVTSTSIGSSVGELAEGRGGNINIEARNFSLNNAQISVFSLGLGKAGNIQINAPESFIVKGSQIGASNFGSEDAGSIILTAANAEMIFDSNLISSTGGGSALSGITSSGQSGNIIIKGRSLNFTNNLINSSTIGKQAAGSIFLTAEKDIFLTQNTISANAAPFDIGRGGIINIQSKSLFLTNSFISSNGIGEGISGDILITVGDRLVSDYSTIATTSRQSSGGNIHITAKDIRLRRDTDIRTDVFSGVGGGGNINLKANTIIALEDSDILAFASDGKGGDITFNTRAFLSSPLYTSPISASSVNLNNQLDGNNRVDVNASGAISGNIIGVPDISFIQNSLTELQNNPIDTNALIANSCIARTPKSEGNFIITGTGGLPYRPGEAVGSNYPTGDVQSVTNNGAASSWKKGEPIVEPQGVYRLANGHLVMSRECH